MAHRSQDCVAGFSTLYIFTGAKLMLHVCKNLKCEFTS